MALGPFAGLDATGRAHVADTLVERSVGEGERLVVQGEPVPGLAVVLAGELAVTRDGRELARLGHGAFVGELALLDHGAPGTATVTVTRDATLAVPREGTGAELLDDPVVGPAIRAVARRRRATNRVAALGPVRLALADGSPIDLRPMWPDDWVLMASGQQRTSRESLHQRFFSVPKLTETTLRRLATVDYVDDFAWVALQPGTDAADAKEPLVGVGRYGRPPGRPDAAEVALLVADDLHGHGLGARLLVALAVAAHEHGIVTFEAVAFAGNRPIRRLLTAAGAQWRTSSDDVALVEAQWPVVEVLERLGSTMDVGALRNLVRQALQPDGT